MQPTSHLDTRLDSFRATIILRALITDLHTQAQVLDNDIQEEQRRTGVFDAADVTYSTLARHLNARRDNLLATIRLLESQLGTTDRAA